MKNVNQFKELTKGNISLLSSQLKSVTLINNNLDLDIEIVFDLSGKHEKTYKLICKSVIEFSFYHTDKNAFYNVEAYKFIITNEGFYISLDPYNEGDNISAEDQNFILCRDVEGGITG